MKSASQNLIDTLHNSKEFLTLDLYTLNINIEGVSHIIRLCNAAYDVDVENVTYYAGCGVLERSQTKLTNELSVDSVTFSLYLANDVFTGIGDLQSAAHGGLLDHTRFSFARAYYKANSEEYVGKVEMFAGECQVVSAGGLLLQLKASSNATSLNLNYPVRRFYPQASYVSDSAGKIYYSEGDNNRSCMIPLKPNKRALL